MTGEAIAFEHGMGWHEIARTDHLVRPEDAEPNDAGDEQSDKDQ